MRKKSKQGKRVLAATRARVNGEPVAKPVQVEEEFELHDEDFTFLQEYGDSLDFLTGFTPEDLEK
jgi:hypothetical protein